MRRRLRFCSLVSSPLRTAGMRFFAVAHAGSPLVINGVPSSRVVISDAVTHACLSALNFIDNNDDDSTTTSQQQHYRTAEDVRDLLCDAVSHIDSPEAATWWCALLMRVANKDELCCATLRTDVVKKSLIAVSVWIVTHETAESWLEIVSRIVDKDASSEVHECFGASDMCECLLSLAPLVVESKNTVAAGKWLTVVSKMCQLCSCKLSFSTKQMHKTFVQISVFASTRITVYQWCAALANVLANNPTGQSVFRTVEIRDAVLAISEYITTDESARVWCSVVSWLCHDSIGRCLLTSKEICNAFLRASTKIATAGAAYWWFRSLAELAKDNAEGQAIFSIQPIFDALLSLVPLIVGDANVSDCASVREFCCAVSYLTVQNKALSVAHAEQLADTLVALRGRVATHLTAFWYCVAIANASMAHEQARAQFVRPAIRDALVDVLPLAVGNDDTIRVWLRAVAFIVKKDRVAQNTFATTPMRDSLVTISSYITSSQSAFWWCGAIANLTMECQEAQRTLLCEALCRGFLACRPYLIDDATSCQWCRAVVALTIKNPAARPLFSTSGMHDAFVHVSRHTSTTKTATWMAHAISEIVQLNPASKDIFVTLAMRDALVTIAQYLHTAEAARTWCSGVYWLSLAATDRGMFRTTHVRDLLFRMANYLDSTGFFWWCRAVSTLITHNAAAQELYAGGRLRRILVTAAKTVVTSDPVAREWCCVAAHTVSYRATPQQMFTTTDIHSSFVVVCKQISTDRSALWWLVALSNIVRQNRAAQIVFGTIEMREALLKMSSLLTTAEHVRCWCSVVYHLILGCPRVMQLFASPVVRALLPVLKPLATTQGATSMLESVSGLLAKHT